MRTPRPPSVNAGGRRRWMPRRTRVARRHAAEVAEAAALEAQAARAEQVANVIEPEEG